MEAVAAYGREWSTQVCFVHASNLHQLILDSLQTRILQRAMRMLEPDGRIVYSTCSLNPVENEAVIAAALNSNPGD
jgi:16S rRNA C967 or C1407 C5-methylase (RsmB/RsmF family)